MKNKCKHKNPSLLININLMGIKWHWCSNCGATRLDKLTNAPTIDAFMGNYKWGKGKWKSPKIAIK